MALGVGVASCRHLKAYCGACNATASGLSSTDNPKKRRIHRSRGQSGTLAGVRGFERRNRIFHVSKSHLSSTRDMIGICLRFKYHQRCQRDCNAAFFNQAILAFLRIDEKASFFEDADYGVRFPPVCPGGSGARSEFGQRLFTRNVE